MPIFQWLMSPWGVPLIAHGVGSYRIRAGAG
jgi:hypothetical protein